jgi:hypothetical protein
MTRTQLYLQLIILQDLKRILTVYKNLAIEILSQQS